MEMQIRNTCNPHRIIKTFKTKAPGVFEFERTGPHSTGKKTPVYSGVNVNTTDAVCENRIDTHSHSDILTYHGTRYPLTSSNGVHSIESRRHDQAMFGTSVARKTQWRLGVARHRPKALDPACRAARGSETHPMC